jgi:CDP-paratose 2-epimerase
MGKTDQGVVALWAARHAYGGGLTYSGFGGEGLQVRDVLHVADLYDLLRIQIADLSRYSGSVHNVGGGHAQSTSLAELTARCRARVRQAVHIEADPRTHDADVPFYVTDNRGVTEATGWSPTRDLDVVLDDVFAWLRDNRAVLEPLLRPRAASAAPAAS